MSVLLLASVIALSGPADAEGPVASLEWSAPAGCPSAAEVREDVEVLLGSGSGPREPLAVEAEVVADPDGYALRLAMETRTGRDVRSIRAPSCEQLARAASLIIATMQDPVAVSDRVDYVQRPRAASVPSIPAPELPPVERVEPVETASPRQVEPTPSEPASAPWRPALRLEGLVGSATLPRVDGGLALAAGLATSRFRVELGASHLFAQTVDHPTLSGVGLRVRATTGTVRGCGVPRWRAWEFPLCVAGEVGAMAARGVGSAVDGATVERSLYASALGEAHVAWRATARFAIWVGGQGVLNLTRPKFTVDPLQPFFQASFGGGRAKLGVEVRFP